MTIFQYLLALLWPLVGVISGLAGFVGWKLDWF